MKTNCIICKCEVENWDIAYPENEEHVHPIGGTAFRTYGHYGSTIFDPMNASYLEVVFCDPCLKERMEYTYEGVNKQYAEELEEHRKKQDELLDFILVERDKNDKGI